MMLWKWAIDSDSRRLNRRAPLRTASAVSPSKYAEFSSTSLKSSSDRIVRFDPNRVWANTTRRLVVSSRNRSDCGRTSGVRWNCPTVCPLTWQSKHDTPATGLAVERSGVRLCRWAGVFSRRNFSPSIWNGVSTSWKSVSKFSSVMSWPFETSPRSGRVVRNSAGGNSGVYASGRSNSTSTRSSPSTTFVCTCGKTMPPTSCSGCHSGTYGNTFCLRISSGVILARSSQVTPCRRAVGPTGTALRPPDIFTCGSVLPDMS